MVGPTNQLNPAGTISDHILIVEDDRVFADELRKWLETSGHRVTVAADAGQAQASFVLKRPDFVLLDLILGEVSGFEVCESLKKQNPDIPVLVLTAIELEDSKQLAARVGADGYLLKPVSPEDLLAEIGRVTELVWRRIHIEGSHAGAPRVKFTCRCGKKFRVSPQHRGRTISCPGCGDSVTVPHHD